MVIGCVAAGAIAIRIGFSWEEVLDGMMKGILDALEAVLILMCIGMLVGTWILSGTVPTLIYYGLSVITPELFLPVAFLGTLVVGIVLGTGLGVDMTEEGSLCFGRKLGWVRSDAV